MKIVAVIHSLDGGGAERVMAALTSALAQRGHDVTLVTLDDAANDRHAVDPRVQRVTLDVMRESRSWYQRVRNTLVRLRTLRRALRAQHASVILSFCDRTNISVLAATLGHHTPIVVAERSDPVAQQLSKGLRFARRKLYRRAARVVSLTQTSATHLRTFCDRPGHATSVVAIASAITPPPIQSDRSVAKDAHRIVAIGRLSPEKGFDRLLHAFASATEPSWSLEILGDGHEHDSLQRLAAELGIAQRVVFAGWVRPVWQRLASATFFVLPSRYEGFPSALLEAMAVGVPCLSVDCESGPREIIKNGHNGLLVENQTAAIADGMRVMIENQELREALGKSGKEVTTRFAFEPMVLAYEALLSEVSTCPRPRRLS